MESQLLTESFSTGKITPEIINLFNKNARDSIKEPSKADKGIKIPWFLLQ